ncbi:hypothetical protein SPRG_08854 [Saprolegnia parasitica CBS 223.65]|uniref:Myb-like domain-containing protein n=1 Tax=Saprolegnia parasitica (strain CBS 223.65) TaxID=695850 RepID=A0A067C5W7_SAPPC|nr:hypothetical protein SPRG_08854 [Saprolegnia parasitica CBS 223.65]KDO25913.1 hypothetical protein SPRG_08854 [Saprolegnia parasitica CBS 223.65]|eukprot:XP_012203473.1 hypothetical protein SPRG_08854 [Saprolegnia parasitica CBS 223.65]
MMMPGSVPDGSSSSPAEGSSTVAETISAAESSSANGAAASASADSQKRKTAFRFRCASDIDLLREVVYIQPFAAPHGQTTDRWTKVATQVAQIHGSGITPNNVRKRFDDLMSAFKQDSLSTLRASGSEEEYQERALLLQDIHDFMTVSNHRKREVKEESVVPDERPDSFLEPPKTSLLKRKLPETQPPPSTIDYFRTAQQNLVDMNQTMSARMASSHSRLSIDRRVPSLHASAGYASSTYTNGAFPGNGAAMDHSANAFTDAPLATKARSNDTESLNEREAPAADSRGATQDRAVNGPRVEKSDDPPVINVDDDDDDKAPAPKARRTESDSLLVIAANAASKLIDVFARANEIKAREVQVALRKVELEEARLALERSERESRFVLERREREMHMEFMKGTLEILKVFASKTS